ncbi:MAG TPA: NAD(P)/FAD-dependent oxidoreductase [Flavobacteriales bacterium]
MGKASPLTDVIVVGGGPAGIAGAMVLGRCRRQVLVLDSGEPRNRSTQAIHGYLTREGIAPSEFLEHARAELKAYDVTWRKCTVQEILRTDQGFRILCVDGTTYEARKVLLATGVRDTVPDIPGAEDCYGKSLFHCPYCDAWEVRDRSIAVLARGDAGAHFAFLLQSWSADVMLFTHGRTGMKRSIRSHLDRAGIAVHTAPIAKLDHERGLLSAVVLQDGRSFPRSALFFNSRFEQHSTMATELGCRTYRTGTVITDRLQRTGVPGLFVAGDAAIGTHFVSVAAAEGAKAAVAINSELVDDALRERALL